MKIKEVMQNTGLSAKTIRYYEECGLISPEAEMINGRKFRDYSDNEIVRLKAIAALRKSLFSIDEISEMMNSPESTADVFENYKQRLSEQKEELEKILRCAENVKQGEDFDAFSLAGQMNYLAQDLPLPKRDVNPNFGKFDDETPEERAQAYLRFQKWYKFRFVKKLYPLLVYLLCFLLTTVVIIAFYRHDSIKSIRADHEFFSENIESTYGKKGISDSSRLELIKDIQRNSLLTDEYCEEIYIQGRYIRISDFSYDDYKNHVFYIDLLSVMSPDELLEFWYDEYWQTHRSWEVDYHPDTEVWGTVYGKLEGNIIIPSRIEMGDGKVFFHGNESDISMDFRRATYSKALSAEAVELCGMVDELRLPVWEEDVKNGHYSAIISTELLLGGETYYYVTKLEDDVYVFSLDQLSGIISFEWAWYLLAMFVATIIMVVRATSKTYKMNFRFYRDNLSSAMAGGNKNSQAYQTSVLIQGKNPDEFLAVGNRGPTGTSGFSSIANFETGDKLSEEKSDN